jgi:hypothetical protein
VLRPFITCWRRSAAKAESRRILRFTAPAGTETSMKVEFLRLMYPSRRIHYSENQGLKFSNQETRAMACDVMLKQALNGAGRARIAVYTTKSQAGHGDRFIYAYIEW